MKSESVVKGFLDKIKASSRLRAVLIVACVAVLILIVFLNLSVGSAAKVSENNDPVTSYISDLESKLERLLSKVDGAGNVGVCITVGSGMETVLAYTTTSTETDSKRETVETPVIVNGKTVVLKELYPKITGVLIVAEGANKLSVYTKLQQAALSRLDISADKIEILAMK